MRPPRECANMLARCASAPPAAYKSTRRVCSAPHVERRLRQISPRRRMRLCGCSPTWTRSPRRLQPRRRPSTPVNPSSRRRRLRWRGRPSRRQPCLRPLRSARLLREEAHGARQPRFPPCRIRSSRSRPHKARVRLPSLLQAEVPRSRRRARTPVFRRTLGVSCRSARVSASSSSGRTARSIRASSSRSTARNLSFASTQASTGGSRLGTCCLRSRGLSHRRARGFSGRPRLASRASCPTCGVLGSSLRRARREVSCRGPRRANRHRSTRAASRTRGRGLR
jgi:hypothetical protein